MEYKKTYTTEELTEIINWAEQNLERMPQSLQLDAASFIPDLHSTMKIYIDICKTHYANPTYGAQIRHIFQMRDKLINENLLLPEK